MMLTPLTNQKGGRQVHIGPSIVWYCAIFDDGPRCKLRPCLGFYVFLWLLLTAA